jgi:hypothetical protein
MGSRERCGSWAVENVLDYPFLFFGNPLLVVFMSLMGRDTSFRVSTKPTAPVYDPWVSIDTRDQPKEYTNPQTSAFCSLVGIARLQKAEV